MAETNYFRKTVPDLIPGKTYYFQFRWKYADGTYSVWSASKTVTAPGSLKVEAPTLATNLTAATASFGVTISWDGTYASSTFLGFKSINIYASTSNLGSSTTTDISANLVGSMTVDQVKNQITIGSTLLKATLSLSSSTVYTTPMYFYYITINENNEVYKSGGVATYTRINSSGISPTQANIIDLVSGTISIENLVAGNGQFQEYLRVGTSPGARVELGANSVATTGAGVTPGFSIYNSANQAVLSAPLSGGLTITSATIKSSYSNKSVRIDPSTNAISFYNNDNTAVSHIVPVGSSGGSYQGIVLHSGSSVLNPDTSGFTSGYPGIFIYKSSPSDIGGYINLFPGGGGSPMGVSITARQYNTSSWYTDVEVGQTRVFDSIQIQSMRPITALSSSAVGSSSPSAATMNSLYASSQEGLIALVYS